MDLINEFEFYDLERESMLIGNLQSRFDLLQKAQNDPKLQAVLKEKCKRDPKFFFNFFLYTIKNTIFFSDAMPNNLPFVLFDYQEEMVDTIWYGITHKRNVFLEKSRQMSVTWVVLGLFLYGFLFHNHFYLITSRSEDEVDGKGATDSCFGRLRFMINLLPQWMLPPGFDKRDGTEYNKTLLISRPDSIGCITGKAPTAVRWGTYNASFIDEMAFIQDARKINTALSPVPCRIWNSTPFWEKGEYFNMRKLAHQQNNLPLENRTIIGISLHWSLHPYYTEKWYKWYCSSRSPEEIEQELEINYTISVQGRVYREFFPAPIGKIIIGEEYDYDPTAPLYCVIDNSHGWTDPHAVILFHVNKHGEIIIFDCLEVNCSITEMASILARRPVGGTFGNNVLSFYERYAKYRQATFIADPNDTHSKWNDTSIASEYAKVGIILTVPNILRGLHGQVDEQIRLVRQNIHRFRIHPRCEQMMTAVQNARYPQGSENSQNTTVRATPIHDWTSHYRTALEYGVMSVIEGEGKMHTTPQKKQIITEIPDHVTGQLITKISYV